MDAEVIDLHERNPFKDYQGALLLWRLNKTRRNWPGHPNIKWMELELYRRDLEAKKRRQVYHPPTDPEKA